MSFQTTILAGKTNHIDKDFMAMAKDFLNGSSGVVNSSDFTVTQSAVVGMSVAVTSGTIYAYISSTSSYYRSYLSDTSTTLNIGSNSSGSTRIDLVCVKTDLTQTPDSNGGGIASLVIVAGTPGAGIPSTPANHYKLAEVTVANGAATIVNANITDKRNVITLNTAMSSQILTDGLVTNRKMKLDQLQTVTSTTDMTTGSTSYVAHSGLTLTFTPNVASNFLVLLQINNYNGAGTGINNFVVKLDGTITGNDPIISRYSVGGDSADTTVAMTQFAFLWITGVTQASHTIQVYGKTNSGGTLHTTYGCLTVIPFSQ